MLEVGLFEVGRRYGAVAPGSGDDGSSCERMVEEGNLEGGQAGGSLSGLYLYLTDVHQVEPLGQIDWRPCALVAKVLVGLP
jgi:hypothetical protein